jgi:hypothetical protein
MLQTLEGVLIALVMVFSPGDRTSEGGPMVSTAVSVGPVAACDRYSSETARRNCIARTERPLETADAGITFDEQISWIAPSDPGMPGRNPLSRPR